MSVCPICCSPVGKLVAREGRVSEFGTCHLIQQTARHMEPRFRGKLLAVLRRSKFCAPISTRNSQIYRSWIPILTIPKITGRTFTAGFHELPSGELLRVFAPRTY